MALRAASLEFSKYQGLGNDFLLVDNRDAAAPKATPAQAQRLCDRHFGVGADGVIFVMPGDAAHDFRMTIYNSDGSEPEMCGNGIRCLAAYLGELGAAGAPRGGGEAFTIATGAGPIVPVVRSDGLITVDICVQIKSSTRLQCARIRIFDTSTSAVLRELAESNRFVQKSAESTSI